MTVAAPLGKEAENHSNSRIAPYGAALAEPYNLEQLFLEFRIRSGPAAANHEYSYSMEES
jgi:hypothetical protein